MLKGGFWGVWRGGGGEGVEGKGNWGLRGAGSEVGSKLRAGAATNGGAGGGRVRDAGAVAGVRVRQVRVRVGHVGVGALIKGGKEWSRCSCRHERKGWVGGLVGVGGSVH